MNQIHVLLSIHNVHVFLGHESDTCITVLYIIHMFCEDMNHKHVLLSIHNVHDLLRYE